MKRIGLTLIAILLVAFPLISQIINVPADQSTIQAAIDAAEAGDTVLVAEGTYFENIYFRGKAITLASMYIIDGDTAHISRTIIDGSKAPDPDNASVVTFNNCQDTTSVLNGFTITGGKGVAKTEFDHLARVAGGIAIFRSGGLVVNNIVRGNSLSAESGYYANGGGIHISNAVEYKNVIIRNNSVYNNHITGNSFSQGGGIFVLANGDTVIIDNNRVYRNSATSTANWEVQGGGIQLHTLIPWSTVMIVKNNLIYENELHCAGSHGGGLSVIFDLYSRNRDGIKSGIEIYNNLITDNYSQEKGGGIALWDIEVNGEGDAAAYSDDHPNPYIYNNTITGNTAADGAGIFNFNMNALLLNNIIWNHSTSGQGEISHTVPMGVPNYSDSVNHGRFQSYFNNIRGGFPGAGNINQDPLFGPGAYTLMENSPCIGWGGDSVFIGENWIRAANSDFLGIKRRMSSADQKTDMGAFESAFEQIKRPGYDSEHIIHVPDEQATIQAAIDAASEMDTVLVAPWLYYENVDFKGKAITLMSYYGMDKDELHISSTVIDGSLPGKSDTASVVRMTSGEDTTSILKGFTLLHGSGTYTESEGITSKEGGGILMFRSGGVIEHNIISGNNIMESGTDWTLGAGISASHDNTRTCIIRNNTITGNTIDTESQSNGAGISLGGANFFVENNQIGNNVCKTTSPVAYGGGLGWWSFDSPGINPNLRIANNNIYQNALNSSSADENTSGGGMRLISSVSSGKIDILNNRVHANTSNGSGAGLALVGTKNTSVRNNLVGDNICELFGSGLVLDGTINTSIQNNLVYNNNCEQAGGGLALYGAKSTVISNNTIFDNVAKRGAKSLFLSEGSSVVLFNNILWSPRINARKEITTNAEDGSNTLYAFHNSIRGAWDVHWNMNVEPAFADDYHLSESSLCIGRGADSIEVGGIWYLAPEKDMVGNPRKNMERIDLGAIESSFARIDSFAITDVDTTMNTPACEGVAVVSFTGGTPPFSFFLDGERNEGNSFESLCSGNYELAVKDADGEMITTTIGIVTGINEPAVETWGLRIYPNPTNNLLTIETEYPDQYSIEITTLNGQQVLIGEMEGATHQIDLTYFESGVYFITIRSNDFITTRKIIKL